METGSRHRMFLNQQKRRDRSTAEPHIRVACQIHPSFDETSQTACLDQPLGSAEPRHRAPCKCANATRRTNDGWQGRCRARTRRGRIVSGSVGALGLGSRGVEKDRFEAPYFGSRKRSSVLVRDSRLRQSVSLRHQRSATEQTVTDLWIRLTPFGGGGRKRRSFLR